MNLFKFNFLQILGLAILIFFQKNNALIIDLAIPKDQIKENAKPYAHLVAGDYGQTIKLNPGKNYADTERWKEYVENAASYGVSLSKPENNIRTMNIGGIKLKNDEVHYANYIIVQNDKEYTISLPPCKKGSDISGGRLCIQSSDIQQGAAVAKESGGGGGAS